MAQPAGGLLGGLEDDPGLLTDRFNGLLDLMQDKHVGGLLDRVDDIVQLGGERVDVLTVKGGDEGGVEPGQDGMGDTVAFVLDLDQPFGLQLRVDEVFEQLVQQPGGLGHVVGCGLKQVEKGLVAGKDSQPHSLYLPVKGNRPRAVVRSTAIGLVLEPLPYESQKGVRWTCGDRPASGDRGVCLPLLSAADPELPTVRDPARSTAAVG